MKYLCENGINHCDGIPCPHAFFRCHRARRQLLRGGSAARLHAQIGLQRTHLPEAGTTLFEQSERILGEIDDMRESVRAVDARPRGLLSITAPIVYGRLHLAPLLPAFIHRYPEVRLNLVLSDSVVDLLENDIDVAVRIAALPDSTLIARRLDSVTRVICASPAYLDRRGMPATPADLSNHDCLPFRFHTAASVWRVGSNLWRLRGHAGVEEVPVGGPFTANNADALVTAALGGLGLILVPTWLVADHLRDGGLVPVLTDHEVSPSDLETAIYAVYPSGRFLSPKTRAFIDFLIEHLGENER